MSSTPQRGGSDARVNSAAEMGRVARPGRRTASTRSAHSRRLATPGVHEVEGAAVGQRDELQDGPARSSVYVGEPNSSATTGSGSPSGRRSAACVILSGKSLPGGP